MRECVGGADLLRLYRCDPETGRWQHATGEVVRSRGFDALCAWRGDAPARDKAPACAAFSTYLAEAERLADAALTAPVWDTDPSMARPERWFAMASDRVA